MNRPASSTDHIYFSSAGLICGHCHQTQSIAYPITINAYVKLAKAFARAHKHCKAK